VIRSFNTNAGARAIVSVLADIGDVRSWPQPREDATVTKRVTAYESDIYEW